MSVIQMIINEIKNMVIPCLIALPVIILIRYLTYKKTGVFKAKREVVIVLYFLYIFALLAAVFTPEHNINNGINQPFLHLPDFSNPETIIYKYSPIGWMRWMISLGNISELIRNIAGNILLFLPFGFLTPVLWKKVGAKTILYGFCLSFFIEFCQLFMDRQTDIYDLVMNTIGVALGYLIYILYQKKKAVRN